jgi:endonuclease YncB( thermonuclease family)
MSRSAHFVSLHSPRRQGRAALAAWTGFGVGVIAGGALAAAVWQHDWVAARVIHRAERLSNETAASRSPTAAPEAGRYAVEVVRVIDGDTFEARVHVWPGFELTTRVRLRSIDAPELKARCSEERAGAEAARDALRVLLNDRNVSIWSIGPDKYFGRIVAEVSTQRTSNVSAALLAKGLVRSYSGGHREGWCDLKVSGG